MSNSRKLEDMKDRRAQAFQRALRGKAGEELNSLVENRADTGVDESQANQNSYLAAATDGLAAELRKHSGVRPPAEVRLTESDLEGA